MFMVRAELGGDSMNRGVVIGFLGELDVLPTKPNLFADAAPRGVRGVAVACCWCCSGTLANKAMREPMLDGRIPG